MYIRVLSITVLALVISLVACKKLQKAFELTITVPYDDAAFVKGLPGDPHVPPSGLKESLGLVKIPTNSQEIVEDNETALSLIKEVKVSELGVQMLLPLAQDWSIMDSVWIYVSANGVPEQLAAYNFAMPSDTTRNITLTPTDADLLDVFIKDTMVVRIEAFFVKDVARESKIKFDMKFKVKADLVD